MDELTAKLCHAEDVGKYHEQVIRQFQSEGFVNVQPPMLTDALLAKEMTEKDNQLKQVLFYIYYVARKKMSSERRA